MKPSDTLPNGRTLAAVQADHRRWSIGDGGTRANLARAYLPGAYLPGADLPGANLARANLARADLRGADLRGADLRGAYLRGAYLPGANLVGACLRGAFLEGADLSGALAGADLTGANLTGVNLAGASLAGAYLTGAHLRGTNLADADLTGANLSVIAEDVRALVRDYPTHEVLGLLRALYLGTVDGSTYSGPCACLVGTIALTRRCPVDDLHTDSSRPAERWALAIRPGDCVATNKVAALTAEWIESELRTRDDCAPGLFGLREEVPEYASPEAYEAAALAMLERARQMRTGD